MSGGLTISGGEPLLHPELDEIIARIRKRGMIAGMITNGYLLNVQRIQRLNDAGLDHMQISIDNIQPDDVSKKSLKVLDKKLELLAEHADFVPPGPALDDLIVRDAEHVDVADAKPFTSRGQRELDELRPSRRWGSPSLASLSRS
jgi:pyruvate formate-lyase activating enzyme-like uncharacterized protein